MRPPPLLHSAYAYYPYAYSLFSDHQGLVICDLIATKALHVILFSPMDCSNIAIISSAAIPNKPQSGLSHVLIHLILVLGPSYLLLPMMLLLWSTMAGFYSFSS